MNKENERPRKEKKEPGGYYAKKPLFGNSGPSLLRQKFSSGMTFFLVIVACLLFYFALLRMSDISSAIGKVIHVLKPIIYGLGIAYLLNPIVDFTESHLEPALERKFGEKVRKKQRIHTISRACGIFAAITVLVVIIFTLFNMMIPELYRSIRNMIITVPSQLNHLVYEIMLLNSKDTTLTQLLNSVLQEVSDHIELWLRSDLLNQINVLMSNLTVGVISVVTEVTNFLLGIIISVYVLFSKEVFGSQCKKLVYALFKPSHANMVLHIAIKSNTIFGGFIIGKIIDSALIGVICFFGLSILDMPYTMLVSVIVGVTNIIPFFGPYIGAIPSAILIMLTDPKMGVYFIIFIIILQQLDGNVIGPKILGDYTGLSVFWVVFAIILGGGLFGFLGMILGVPAFAVFYYIVNMLIDNRLQKKNLPQETAAYSGDSFVDVNGVYVHQDKNDTEEEE